MRDLLTDCVGDASWCLRHGLAPQSFGKLNDLVRELRTIAPEPQ